MKQVWYEWKKLISDKSVLLVVVLSMCIVLGYQWKMLIVMPGSGMNPIGNIMRMHLQQ